MPLNATRITVTISDPTGVSFEQYYNSQLTKTKEFLLLHRQPLDCLQPLRTLPDNELKKAISFFLYQWWNVQNRITETNPTEPMALALRDFQFNSILLASSLAKPHVIDAERKINTLNSSLVYLWDALAAGSRYSRWYHFADSMQSLEDTITHHHTTPPNPLLGQLMFAAAGLLTLGVACVALTTLNLCALLVAGVMNCLLVAYVCMEMNRESAEYIREGERVNRGDGVKVEITQNAAASLKTLSLFSHNQPPVSQRIQAVDERRLYTPV